MKKYEFTNVTKERYGITLHRIRALKDFGNVKAGDLGGWIEKEENLSHEGNCWVANEACVYGYARVYGDAKVHEDARVYENACVYGYAHVYGYARVHEDAKVHEDARVYENACVYGYAQVYEYAHISGYTRVYGKARVYEYAHVYGCAQVYGNARIYREARVFGDARIHGTARVYGNAVIKERMDVQYSICATDLSTNLVDSIRCQTGLQVFGDHVITFKHVHEDLSSIHDPDFKYVVGEWIEAVDPDMDKTESCASGLHVSNATYWEYQGGKVLLMCKVMLEDIIAVQAGKIRCKKLYVIASTTKGVH